MGNELVTNIPLDDRNKECEITNQNETLNTPVPHSDEEDYYTIDTQEIQTLIIMFYPLLIWQTILVM